MHNARLIKIINIFSEQKIQTNHTFSVKQFKFKCIGNWETSNQ